MMPFIVVVLALLRVVESSVWVRGNYTTLTVADDLSSLAVSACNLSFTSSIAPAPVASVATSGVGLWGAYDELTLTDATNSTMYALRYFAGADAFTFERFYDGNDAAVFPLFVPLANNSVSLLAYAETYMLHGSLVPSLNACVGQSTKSATGTCDLTGVVRCNLHARFFSRLTRASPWHAVVL